MRATQGSCHFEIGFHEENSLDYIERSVKTRMGAFFKFSCVGHPGSGLEKAEFTDDNGNEEI